MLHNFEDDNLLETLSIPTNYSGPFSQGENTPTTLPTLNHEDAESSVSSSKKIRKKRNTYQKIDDDIRLKLLEAVQNGETLKAVAKRCNINYSSAKSILHTYRKEGRILKKSGQDRPFESLYMSQTMQNAQEPLTVPSQQQQFPVMTNNLQNFPPPQAMTQKLDFSRIEPECPMNNNMNTQNSSPTNGLMNNFMTKLNLGGGNNNVPSMPFPQTIMRPQPMGTMNPPQYPMFPMGSMYPMGNPMPNQMPQMNSMMRPFNHNPHNPHNLQNPHMPMPNIPLSSEAVPMMPLNNFNHNPFARAMNMSPVNAASLSEQLLNTNNNNSPLAQLKNFDNFYMNYSNSPLSGGGRMANDNTDSSAKNLNAPKEFESFSDMVSAMQGFTANQTEDKFMPQLVRGIPSIGSLEKIDFPPQEFNSGSAQGSLKALMDQQYMVGDALKKASYYKDLSPFQKLNPEAGSLPNVKLLNLMG